MAFITYFDLREAENAKNDLQDAEVEGRPIDIHYSIPREDEEHEDQDPNNGTLFVCIKDPTEKFTNDDIYILFRQWGDIKEVRDCKGKPNQKFVECWDLRHSEQMFQQRQDTPFAGGMLDIKHAYKSTREREREREGGKPVRRKNVETSQGTNNNNTLQYPYTGTQNNNQSISNILTQLSQLVNGGNVTQSQTNQGLPLTKETLQALLFSQQPNLQTNTLQSQQTPGTYSTLGTNYNYLQSNYNTIPQLSGLNNYTSQLQSVNQQTPTTTSSYSLQNQNNLGTTLGTSLGSTLGTTSTSNLTGVQTTNNLTGVQTPYNIQTNQTPNQTTGYTSNYLSQQTYNPYNTYIPQ